MSESEGSVHNSQGETTFEGRVEILGDFPRPKHRHRRRVTRQGKHIGLFLITDNGRIIIDLGPAAYFVHHNFQIRAGDPLKVTGVQVIEGAMPLVQASEVKTRDKKLKLRDKNGLPLWPAAMDRLN